MQVIVDTNVLVSGLISDSGPPAEIVDALLQGRLIPLMSEATFAELEEVLNRPRLQPYFRRSALTPYQFLSNLEKVARFVKPKATKSKIRDETDRVFLDLAATRPAPDFLITGDKDFEQNRYTGVTVISASLFVKTILRPR